MREGVTGAKELKSRRKGVVHFYFVEVGLGILEVVFRSVNKKFIFWGGLGMSSGKGNLFGRGKNFFEIPLRGLCILEIGRIFDDRKPRLHMRHDSEKLLECGCVRTTGE